MYDHSHCLRFAPLQLQMWQLSYMAQVMHLPDEEFLHKVSTSPMHEAVSFCDGRLGCMLVCV